MSAAVETGPATGARHWTRYTDYLWWPLIIFAFATPCFIGTIGSIASVIVAVLALPLLLDPAAWRSLRRQWGIFVFPIVFVMLGVIFAIHADEWADMRFLFNFTALPLALPVFVLARRHQAGRWPLVVIALAFAGALLGVGVGGYQVSVQDARRAIGWFNNPNMFAHIALLFGFMSLAGLYMTRSLWRYLFLAGPFLGLAVTIMSGSRGTMLAVPALGLIALIYLLTRPTGKKWVLAGLALACVTGVIWLVFFAQLQGGLERLAGTVSTMIEVIRTGNSNEIGTQARLAVYYGAWEAWVAHPITGYGWADAIPAATQLIVRPKVLALALTFPHMHSDWLGFAVGAGIFGLVGFFAMMVSPLTTLWRFDRLFAHRAFIAVTLVTSYAIFGLFDAMWGFDTGISTFVFLTAILAGSFTAPDAPGGNSALNSPR